MKVSTTNYIETFGQRSPKNRIEEGYLAYGNFEFENGNFEKQSGELKWGN